MYHSVIYVSGQLTPRRWPVGLRWLERIVNILRAAWAGVQLMKRGYAVIVPHSMSCLFPLLSRYRLTWNDYIAADLELVRRCDGLLYLGSSPGADAELAEAKRQGLRIYRSLAEVPDLTREPKNSPAVAYAEQDAMLELQQENTDTTRCSCSPPTASPDRELPRQ